MTGLFQDVRYALRQLRKRPGFTAVVLITLALGIGANSAIFSVVNAVLLRPLPYLHPNRLVFLAESSKQVPDMSISMADFDDWRTMNSVFESTVAYQTENVTLTGQGQAEELRMRRVTAGLFPTLGVRPILGRPLGLDDDKVGAPPVVLLSDTMWAKKFARDPNVIGKQLTLDGEPFTVIGVLPNSQFHENWKHFDIFTSLWRLEDQFGGPTRRDSHPGIYAYALLKPGVTVEQTRAQLDSIAGRLAKQYPKSNLGITISVEPLLGAIVEDVRPSLLILMGAVGFVLLICCANVANLLMARATERQREVAIRKALGAGRWRLARQLLTESVLLAFLGGIFGLLIAWWTTRGLASATSGAVPRIADVRVDGWVLCFTLGLALLTGVVFGVFPVLHSSHADVNDALKENSAGSGTGKVRKRLREVLVVGELAISLVLLVGAGLTLESLFHVLRSDPGFKPDGVLTARFSLPDLKYKTDDQRRQLVAGLTEKLASIPGVQAAGFKDPLLGGWQSSFAIGERPLPDPEHLPSAEMSRVGPGALEAMNSELLRGRFFTPGDSENTPKVCIIDDRLAGQYWPGEDPVGKPVLMDEPKPGEQPPVTTVVGVIHEIKNYGVDQPVLPEIFVPYAQRPSGGGNLVIRSFADASAMTNAMRAAAQSFDPDLPVYDVRTLESFVAENVAPRRLSVLLLSLFAGLALALATVGIYGVMSYSVTQRHREIGIRMALGAQTGDVLTLVVRQGTWLAAAGVGIGLIAALAATRLIARLLFGIQPSDPLTFITVALLLSMVALVASYIPARRAARIDPMVALRYE
ncbi:MAG TPA: ABC transporter permease [Candidatus Sulfotelmatobacter sp.]